MNIEITNNDVEDCHGLDKSSKSTIAPLVNRKYLRNQSLVLSQIRNCM